MYEESILDTLESREKYPDTKIEIYLIRINM